MADPLSPVKSEKNQGAAQEWRDLRRTQDRDYVSAGVAMVLALVSEVEPIPPPDERAAARGAELAEPLDRYGRVLQGGHRDGDLGVTASVLQALAYGEFDPGLRR